MIFAIGSALVVTAFLRDRVFGLFVSLIGGLGIIAFGMFVYVAVSYSSAAYEHTGEVGRYAIIETKNNGVVKFAGGIDRVVELEFTYDKGNGALETIKPYHYEYVYDAGLSDGEEYIVIYNCKFRAGAYFFSGPKHDFTDVTIYTSDVNKGGVNSFSAVKQNLEVIPEGL